MRSAGIADGDMRADYAGNPLCASKKRKHQLYATQVWLQARGFCTEGVWYPHIDLYFVVKVVRQWNQFYIWRHYMQETLIDFCRITNSQHVFALLKKQSVCYLRNLRSASTQASIALMGMA